MERLLGHSRYPETRQSFARLEILRKIAYASATMYGLMQAGSSVSQPQPRQPHLGSIDDVVTLARLETGEDATPKKIVKEKTNVVPNSDKAPPAKTEVKESADEHLWKSWNDAYRWLMNYQAPPKTTDDIDCNDRAREICERLEAHGLPMYYLNLVPRESFFKSWHQAAVCKVDNSYVVIDNGRTSVVENMSLEAFFSKHESQRLVPYYAIAEHEKPRYELGPTRFLQTILNRRSAQDMQGVKLETPVAQAAN